VLGLFSGLLLATGLIPIPTTASKLIPSAFEVLYIFTIINFVLCFFNLLPLFPLDGEKIAVRFLPREWADALAKLRRFSFGPLILVIWLLPRLGVPVLDWLVFNPALWLTNLFLGA
jgi:Zn-dependent protease